MCLKPLSVCHIGQQILVRLFLFKSRSSKVFETFSVEFRVLTWLAYYYDLPISTQDLIECKHDVSSLLQV